MKFGLLSLCQEALICGQATTHEIHIDLTTNQLSIDKNIQESTSKILILPNYGILACGTTVEDAWHKTFHLILACESQLRAVSIGLNNLILPSDDSTKQVNKYILIKIKKIIFFFILFRLQIQLVQVVVESIQQMLNGLLVNLNGQH